MRMAKLQKATLDPSKISGRCGRLKCCLRYEFDVYHDILATKGSWEEKLDYAMRDPAFLGHDEFARSLWLLNHPAVCKVRYEDLVGPRGGGTAEAQLDAVSRLVRHIDSDADPAEIAARVYDPGSWSFHHDVHGADAMVRTRDTAPHRRGTGLSAPPREGAPRRGGNAPRRVASGPCTGSADSLGLRSDSRRPGPRSLQEVRPCARCASWRSPTTGRA